MRARVNGREHSRGNVSSLHHPIPRLIAQASRDSELYPGDLIGTGPVGTGCILELGPEAAGGWLKPGDYVELEVENLDSWHSDRGQDTERRLRGAPCPSRKTTNNNNIKKC